ncbi:MAG: hypothetical protein H6985_15860 [Pseudomonadales bacterium]|nr:hypothetical protein [Halioglobus sp.]MCP5131049.1 hypothetical protein [Pseudomonadales bacterium]
MYNRITLGMGWRAMTLALSAWVLAMAATPAAAQPAYASAAVPVGDVTLRVESSVSEKDMLDVGLVIFDAGIPIDEASHSMLGIFPEIRKAEAKFMPVLLRQVLLQSNAWGVVRVLPDEQNSTELMVTGKIRESNGTSLVLEVEAWDATGRQWLDKTYSDTTTDRDYPGTEGSDPFIDMYRKIANDLLAFRQGLNARELGVIREVALLRYAASLSEDAFGSYLQRSPEGIYSVVRLPAENDPMLVRVERIRDQEHLFIDTVDEQYVTLYEDMAATYNLWRQYGREQALYQQDYEERAQTKERIGRRGTFVAMEQTYNTYKQIKIQEQDLDEMATGFNNEVAPTVMEASGRVFRLSGGLDAQYNEWRTILREIFALETGLPPAS